VPSLAGTPEAFVTNVCVESDTGKAKAALPALKMVTINKDREINSNATPGTHFLL